MGSDDLYHKRKARKIASLRRVIAKRSPYDVVLIVCEGAKTEPYYFQELKDALRLNNANITICGKECGSDPLSVVNHALKTFKDDPIYDNVFCVFDRDRHTTYHAALDKIQRARLGKGAKIYAITSIPCFEFWLLLHFKYTTRPFVASGGSSICNHVLKELNKDIPGYQKGARQIFTQTKANLETAINRAKKVEQYNKDSGADNPSTKIYTLVKYLQNLKK